VHCCGEWCFRRMLGLDSQARPGLGCGGEEDFVSTCCWLLTETDMFAVCLLGGFGQKRPGGGTGVSLGPIQGNLREPKKKAPGQQWGSTCSVRGKLARLGNQRPGSPVQDVMSGHRWADPRLCRLPLLVADTGPTSLPRTTYKLGLAPVILRD